MSNVRTDIPPVGVAFTDDVRQNFATIKQELEVLQAFMASAKLSDSPIFTGVVQMASAVMSGSLAIAGTFGPSSESYVTTNTPALTSGGNISSVGYDLNFGPPKFCKNALGEVTICGSVNPTFSAGGLGQIVAIGGLPATFCNSGNALTIPVLNFLSSTVIGLVINPLGQVQLFNPGGAGAYQIFLCGTYRPVS